MCLAQGPQRSDADEARTRGSSVWTQALYHLAMALPEKLLLGRKESKKQNKINVSFREAARLIARNSYITLLYTIDPSFLLVDICLELSTFH